MDISYFIGHYGYLAIVIGSIIEGETFAVLGGIAANQGLSLPMVYLMAFAGAWLCDSILFLVGHYNGTKILKRLTKYQNRLDRIEYMVIKYDLLAIIGLRFLYGLRTIGPMFLGVVGVNRVRFIICNAVGSALWSAIFVTLGYSAGRIFEKQFYGLKSNLTLVLVFALIVFTVFLIVRLVLSYRSRQRHLKKTELL